MKTIKLTQLKLQNFKGIRDLEVNLNNDLTSITGANGVGKSSIYNAYLWCVFGIGANSKSNTVQPLDENNEPIHKVVTQVEAVLMVDNQQITLTKELQEDWQVPKGTTKEVLKGLKTECYFDSVPCSVTEYKKKVDAIFAADKWAMLSVVGSFFRGKTEDKRRMLNDIAPSIDEVSILANYPNVLAAITAGKTIEDYTKEVRITHKKAQTQLYEIPARIDQSEKMRSTADFKALKEQKTQVETELEMLQTAIEEQAANTPEDTYTAAIKAKSKEIEEARTDINDIETSVARERTNKMNELQDKQTKIYRQDSNLTDELLEIDKKFGRLNSQIAQAQAEFNHFGTQWQEENTKRFDHTDLTVCTECGREYTEEMKSEARQCAVQNFNSKKVETLKLIEAKAQVTKDEIAKLNNDKSLLEAELTTKLSERETKRTEHKQIQQKIDNVPTIEHALRAHVEYSNLSDKLDTLRREYNNLLEKKADDTPQLVDYSAQQRELLAKLGEITKELAKEDANKRIDKLIEELNNDAETHAQTVSDSMGLEEEIAAYKKAMCEAVETSVSSLFDLIKWKMFEKNITNDGEKPICDAIVDGVPYGDDDLNTAARCNAGLDLINAFCKASDISIPVFIDNKESTSELLPSHNQIITLSVQDGQELTIN